MAVVRTNHEATINRLSLEISLTEFYTNRETSSNGFCQDSGISDSNQDRDAPRRFPQKVCARVADVTVWRVFVGKALGFILGALVLQSGSCTVV